MEEETKNKAVKTIYVVYALDYSYKESENIDKRDLTQYVCRVFTRMADAEQYIMDFFKKFAADDATLSITKTKNGFMLAELKDMHSDKGVAYNTVVQVQTQEITEELEEYNLFDDMHAVYNG